MNNTSQVKRRRLRRRIQPAAFKGISIPLQERIRMRETELKASGLWQFLSELVIPWPSQCELEELVENYMQQDYS